MNNITTTPADTAVNLYRAVQNGDIAAAAQYLADDVVLHVPGTHALAGDHHGAAGILAFLEGIRAFTASGEDIEILDVLDGRDHAALYCRVTAERAGRPSLENFTIHLFRVRDGRVVEIWLHNRDERTVDAFWS